MAARETGMVLTPPPGVLPAPSPEDNDTGAPHERTTIRGVTTVARVRASGSTAWPAAPPFYAGRAKCGVDARCRRSRPSRASPQWALRTGRWSPAEHQRQRWPEIL